MEQELLKDIKDGLGELKKTNETLLGSYNQLTKETKTAMEELTKLKNQQASMEQIMQSMRKLNAHLWNERRMAWGDPAKRIAHDEEKRNLFIARLALSLDIVQRAPEHIRAICKDLDTGNTPGSTYIANNELERDIYDLLASYGAFNQLDVRRVGAKTAELRLKTARVAALFVDEAAQIGADSAKAGSKVTVTPGKIAALISVSSELLQDDIGGLVEDVLNDMAEAFAYRIDWISFTADGSADNVDGGFTGMFYGGTNRTAANGNTTTATLDYEDWLACIANLPVGLLQHGGCKWFANPVMVVKSMYVKGADGRPIFQSAIEAPNANSIGTILGYGVAPVAAAPSTDSAGGLVASFGDPRAQAVRIRRDITFDRSEHWAFDTDEMTFRGTARAGSKTKQATAFQILKLAAS